MVYYSIVKRKVFFWVLVALFFLIAPLSIGYALGYRYSFQRGVFVYAGSLTISSNPQTIDMRIDLQPAPKGKQGYLNNSYHIDGMYPGEYFLEVSSPGFVPWSKHVEVHSGVSTEFWNVLLARESYEPRKLSGAGVQRFFLSPKRNVIAYTLENEGEFSIVVINTESSETKQVFASREWKYDRSEKENIEWSPQNDALIVPVVSAKAGDKEKTYIVVYIETGTTVKMSDIVSTDTMHAVRWSPNQKGFLYFMDESKLFFLNVRDPKQLSVVSDDVSGYDIGNGSVYTLQKTNSILFQYELDGKPVRQISATPLFEMVSDDKSRIVAYDENRIAVLRSDGVMAVYNQGDHQTKTGKVAEYVMDVQFSDDGKKLLYWSDKEVHVYFMRDWDVQPLHSEGETLDVARFFDPIQNVHWSKDYEHVIYVHDGFIKGIELDKRDKQNIFVIQSLRNPWSSSVFSDTGNNAVYFTDAQEGYDGMFLYSIEFPEKVGFLGF